MTDLAIAEPEALPSTVLDTDTATAPSGAGAPRSLADEGPTLRDTVAAEVKADAEAKPDTPDDEEKPDKAAEKPKAEAKVPEAKETLKAPERGPDGKFAGKQAEGEPKPDTEAEVKEPKPTGHIEPPKSFLPDAKETWRNTPRAVQRDVENAFREHETQLAQAKEASERYEALRPFDEAARQTGRAGAHESLAGLNQILMQAGPRKGDGQPISLFELAQAIVNSGQDGYQRMLSQQPQTPQQQRDDPRISQLEQRIAQMQEQQLAASVIEPFKAANPRYAELEDDIAFFLESGKIPNSLSPSDRLAAAYDMAARINPASHDSPATETDLEPARRADEPFSAGKSIKSAPGAVNPDMEPDRGGSIRDLLADELRRKQRS
jgi:hypothetical protein